MRSSPRLLIVLVLSLVSARHAQAQTSSAAGHWQGSINAPFGEVGIAVDLAMDGGTMQGRFTNPGEQINGLPFARVTVDGRSIQMHLKDGERSNTFRGTLSSDGQTITGDFLISVYAVPFTLRRVGEARFEPAPTSPAIDRAFEGTWHAEIAVDGGTRSMVLTMRNQDDRTATGTWATPDGVEIPITMAVDGSRVKIASNVTRETFVGSLDSDGAGIVGTLTEGAAELPLTFRKAR